MEALERNITSQAGGMGNGSQSLLLSSKALWRQGFLRCPEYCSSDTPSSDCACSCPEKLRELAFGEQVDSLELGKDWVEERDAVAGADGPLLAARGAGEAGDGPRELCRLVRHLSIGLKLHFSFS